MKNQHNAALAAEYILLFLFLAVPPLAVSSQPSPALPEFTAPTLLMYFCVICFLGTVKIRYRQTADIPGQRKLRPFILCLYTLIVFFALLIPTACLNPAAETNAVVIPNWKRPEGIDMLYFITGTIFAACYEEILYRYYMPLVLHYLLGKLSNNKTRFLYAAEAIPLLLFALSHRYNGVFAVLNAAAAGCILRAGIRISGSAIPSCIGHSLYNIVIYMYIFSR